MSNGLTILHSLLEWEDYKSKYAAANGWSPGQVDWGPGPGQFPCLVGSASGGDMRVISCYIYVEDAVRLLSAAGVIEGGDEQEEITIEQQIMRLDLSKLLALVAAMLVTMDGFITKKEDFEKKLATVTEDLRTNGTDSEHWAVRTLMGVLTA